MDWYVELDKRIAEELPDLKVVCDEGFTVVEFFVYIVMRFMCGCGVYR